MLHLWPYIPLEHFCLSEMLKSAQPVDEVYEQDKGRWSREGNFYCNAASPEKSWQRLTVDERVLFASDKVLAYSSENGVHLAVRGDDLEMARLGLERALVQIVCDSGGKVMSLHVLQPYKRHLSRSSLAIQLTDSGIFDRFPDLEELLRYQIVWQKVDGGLRHRELFDSYEVRFDLLEQALSSPEKIGPDEISNIVQFRFFKSRVIRRRALAALQKLHEAKRITQADFSQYCSSFLGEDIREDMRVIERSIKNKPSFVSDIFNNQFGIAGIEPRDLRSVMLEYFDQGPLKEIYLGTLTLQDENQYRTVFTVVRPDAINDQCAYTEKHIKRSIEVWQRLSQAGVKEIVKFGGHAQETDYRDRDVVLGGGPDKENRIQLVNNIGVSSRPFVTGPSLAAILADKDLPPANKQAAIATCVGLCETIFRRSKELLGLGYFIDRPEASSFILTETGNGQYAATLAETYKLVDYPSEARLLATFRECLPKTEGVNA